MLIIKKRSDSKKSDWQKADARVLGQILAAQNIEFALPDIDHIAEFYTNTLISVPGITSCRVCLGDISAQAGEMESSFCTDCIALRKTSLEFGIIIPANLDFKCNLADQPGIRFIAIDSYQHHFGFFVFKIKNTTVFDLYQPFISNLANYIAISLENRLQGDLLQKAHDELERRVEERTAELKNANEILLQEITERKRAEEALKEQYSTLRSIIDSANTLIFSVDQHYRYTSFNKGHAAAMKALYGAQIELGHNVLDYMTVPEDCKTARHNLDRALAGDQLVEEAYSGEELLSRQYFQVSHSPIKTDEEEIIGVAVLASDMTERKRAEEELEKYHEHLEELVRERTVELAEARDRAESADRLKSTFLATMSHELRTPLNSIIGFTGIMLQGLAGPLNDEQTKQLGMVRKSADHLLSLINDVLDISKIEAGQVQMSVAHFDMRNAIETAVKSLEPLAMNKGLPINVEVTPNVGMIIGDRRRVEQILFNLLHNAIKFTEHGEVKVKCQVENGSIITHIIDTGIGIKPEQMENLFKPFVQLESGIIRRYEGTGLGLSISKKLVEMQGGQIKAESAWGKGSTFTFSLPQRREEP